MPPTLNYPGVYIEELPSGVHTITGVATSIAAFIGWAPKGPNQEATLVQSWLDYQNQFGGLDPRSYLGYSVQQFFRNGGQQAYIVRMVADGTHSTIAAATASVTLTALTFDTGTLTPAGTSTVTATATASTASGLTFSALSPGLWANPLAVVIQPRPDDYTRFGLTVVSIDPVSLAQTMLESFPNLSLTPSDSQGRYLVNVVNEQSNYLGVTMQSTPLALTNQPSSIPSILPPPGSATVAFASGSVGADGTVLAPAATPGTPGPFEDVLVAAGTGYALLQNVPIFNLLCVPGEIDPATISTLQGNCVAQKAFYIVDCQQGDSFRTLQAGPNGTIAGASAINSAFYFPWVDAFDPQQNMTRAFPPCGFVAGLYAATDSNRGIWKAPAGIDASLSGEAGLSAGLTDLQNGTLNVQAVNCLRNFPVYGDVVWGARTLRGNDQTGSEWKYVPVRRLALFLEQSLYQGLQWVVFEPNDSPLWGQIRLNVGAFMQSLFRKGAFQGSSPQEAYFVKCDSETTTQNDINNGVVNILVGFAPLKPAEFVVLQLQQIAGQIQA